MSKLRGGAMREMKVHTAGPGGPAGPVSPSLPGRPWIGQGGRRRRVKIESRQSKRTS